MHPQNRVENAARELVSSARSATEATFTIPEIAESAKVSVMTVRREIRSGALGHYRIGRSIRIGAHHVAEWLAAAERTAA